MSLRWTCLFTGMLASCSFPDINIFVTSGGGSDAAGAGGAGGSGAGAQGAGGDGAGATGGTSSTGMGGAPGCVNKDGDRDGFIEAEEGCCVVNSTCDCDDSLGTISPDQTDFFTTPRSGIDPGSPLAYDYNCDGMSEKQWEEGDCLTLGQCTTSSEDVVFKSGDGHVCGAAGFRRHCNGVTCVQAAESLGCR